MSYNPFSLSGKHILVTGASSGIGKQTAIECSRLGASLTITGRDKSRLQDTFNLLDTSSDAAHQMVVADLVINEQLENILSLVKNVDGMVLCAGRGLTLPVPFCTREKFDSIFEINFFSVIELLRLFYKNRKISKGGSVVLLASLGGTRIFSGGNSIYGASKAALNSMMRFCAKEFAQRKVRVNSISPGMVDTPLIHRGTISEEQLIEDQQRYPLKRYGTPEDIAYGAVYLLSDASSWMTGQELVLDGGVSIK